MEEKGLGMVMLKLTGVSLRWAIRTNTMEGSFPPSIPPRSYKRVIKLDESQRMAENKRKTPHEAAAEERKETKVSQRVALFMSPKRVDPRLKT
jgi:hypothetical protein